jgi:hypothetical protein
LPPGAVVPKRDVADAGLGLAAAGRGQLARAGGVVQAAACGGQEQISGVVVQPLGLLEDRVAGQRQSVGVGRFGRVVADVGANEALITIICNSSRQRWEASELRMRTTSPLTRHR